jgi:hypothetical protein
MATFRAVRHDSVIVELDRCLIVAGEPKRVVPMAFMRKPFARCAQPNVPLTCRV